MPSAPQPQAVSGDLEPAQSTGPARTRRDQPPKGPPGELQVPHLGEPSSHLHPTCTPASPSRPLPVPCLPPPLSAGSSPILSGTAANRLRLPTRAAGDLRWLYRGVWPVPPLALGDGKRPSSCTPVLHLRCLPVPSESPRCPLGGELARTEPNPPLQLSVAGSFFVYFKHTRTLFHTHTRQAPHPQQHASLLSGADPAKKAPSRRGGEGASERWKPAPCSCLLCPSRAPGAPAYENHQEGKRGLTSESYLGASDRVTSLPAPCFRAGSGPTACFPPLTLLATPPSCGRGGHAGSPALLAVRGVYRVPAPLHPRRSGSHNRGALSSGHTSQLQDWTSAAGGRTWCPTSGLQSPEEVPRGCEGQDQPETKEMAE